MKITFAFDVYGTLIDPLAISRQLEEYVGGDAQQLSKLWREKQLEYTFRRGLMNHYRPFSEVTLAAFEYASETMGIRLSSNVKQALMSQYRMLDAYEDTKPILNKLVTKKANLHACSNGQSDDIAALLQHAGIDSLINSIVSVEGVKTFKPDPGVYRYFNEQTNSLPEETWLVSSNSFDIIGAAACGWNTAWVKRNDSMVFDPWEHSPTIVINSLNELEGLLDD